MTVLFKAPISSTVKTITAGIIIIVASTGITVTMVSILQGFLMLGILITTFLFLVIMISYLLMPRGYTITSSKIIIHRLWKDIEIPRNEIAYALQLNKHRVLHESVKLGGSGGLFGYYGLFWIKNLGKAWLYVTDENRMILIKLKSGKTYIISPDRPRLFLEILGITI